MTSLNRDQRIVEWLVRDLTSEDPAVRETSLDRLGSLPGDHIDLIATRLADPDPEVRGSAAANLGGVRLPDAWPHLVQAARKEPSDEVRRTIVLALENYHDQEILDVLLELLAQGERDYRIHLNAVAQLWKYDPTIVVPRLMALLLENVHSLVRLHAADSLELLDELCAPDLPRQQFWLRLAEDADPAVSGLATRALNRQLAAPPADILALIVRRLHHSEPDERSIALHRLSMLAPASAVIFAKPLLEDDHPEVRVACCACLGSIHDAAGVPLLITELRSDLESRVQTAALLGLENYHTAQIGDALLEVLEKGDLAGNALSILCRQLWKYPSSRTVLLLQRVLASSVKLPHRPAVESALAFLLRLVSQASAPPAI
jgi:HEAT repeat protein